MAKTKNEKIFDKFGDTKLTVATIASSAGACLVLTASAATKAPNPVVKAAGYILTGMATAFGAADILVRTNNYLTTDENGNPIKDIHKEVEKDAATLEKNIAKIKAEKKAAAEKPVEEVLETPAEPEKVPETSAEPEEVLETPAEPEKLTEAVEASTEDLNEAIAEAVTEAITETTKEVTENIKTETPKPQQPKPAKPKEPVKKDAEKEAAKRIISTSKPTKSKPTKKQKTPKKKPAKG